MSLHGLAVRDVVTRAIDEAPWWWDKLHEAND